MDVHVFLQVLFGLLAFLLPLLIVPTHLHDGFKLGLGLSAGLMAAVSSWSMANRLSGFLDTHIPETQICWMDKPEIVALFVFGCSVFSLAVFTWVIPATKQCAMNLVPSFREIHRPNGVGVESMDFMFEHESFLGKWTNAVFRMTANSLGVIAGVTAIVAYLAWPSVVLMLDLQKRNDENRMRIEAEEHARDEQTHAKRAAIAVTEQGNELMRQFIRRGRYCKPLSQCKQIFAARRDEVTAEVQAFKIKMAGDFISPEDAVKKLTDVEFSRSLSTRFVGIAKRNNVSLAAPKDPTQAKREKRGFIGEDEKAEKLADKVLAMLSDPKKLIAPLTADLATAISIGLEALAITLVFFASRTRRDDTQSA